MRINVCSTVKIVSVSCFLETSLNWYYGVFMIRTETFRNQVRKYRANANVDSLRRVNAILEIDQNKGELWNDKEFVAELDRRYDVLESGEEKGITTEELEISFEKRRLARYSK